MLLRLAILSNAGGSGKTTLATHLTYALAKANYNVALMDLDPQGSVSLFCGLPRTTLGKTISSVLSKKKFLGNYPLQPVWSEQVAQAFVCEGDLELVETIDVLSHHPRGAYMLSDRLNDYPLKQDLIIFDCPATLGKLPINAIAAATHILIPIQVEPKSTGGASKLLEWLYDTFTMLRLEPEPKILGIVPNQYDHRIAIHRNILEQLTPMLQKIGIHCFAPIRFSSEFKNASAMGVPLHLYRPRHPGCFDFNPIIKALKTELGKEEQQWVAG